MSAKGIIKRNHQKIISTPRYIPFTFYQPFYFIPLYIAVSLCSNFSLVAFTIVIVTIARRAG